MIWNVTFKATKESIEDGSMKTIREVALVSAVSPTDAEASIQSSILDKHKDLNLSGVEVMSISPAHITEIHKGEEGDDFFKARIGFKDADAKKYSYEYWLIQAETIDSAVLKVKRLALDRGGSFDLYSFSRAKTLVLDDLVKDYIK